MPLEINYCGVGVALSKVLKCSGRRKVFE